MGRGETQALSRVALTVFQHIGPILLATSGGSMLGSGDMQSTSPRTNNTPPEISERANINQVDEIDLVHQEAGPSNSKGAFDIAANANSLTQRGTSLGELQTMIREFQQLHQFLASEGERLEREISEYAQLSKSTLGSARPIAENILRWKKQVRTGLER